MNIEITFVNESYDQNNSSIVIFQKNVATSFEEIAVAWQVIKNCGRNWSHKFKYSMDFMVGAEDSSGNVSDLQPALDGQKWNVIRSSSGDVLSLDPSGASSQREVEVKNFLPQGAINAQIYKSGKLLATKTGVSPQQKAVFQFNPTIWVGVVSEIEEGEIMNSAILSDINTEISLLGLTKADLLMTGGGAYPFKFTLVPTA